MAGVDYSKVALFYKWIERAVFGGKLQRARVALLSQLISEIHDECDTRVLVVGDGDGRFCAELLKRTSRLRVDYVDCSEGMVRLAKKSVGDSDRVAWCCEDLRSLDGAGYDAVVAHFLLDGFEGDERKAVLRGLLKKVKAGGVFHMSDFDPVAKVWGQTLVRAMQVFFAVSAGLPFVQVVRDDAEVEASGGIKMSEKCWQKGWIYTQLWKIR